MNSLRVSSSVAACCAAVLGVFVLFVCPAVGVLLLLLVVVLLLLVAVAVEVVAFGVLVATAAVLGVTCLLVEAADVLAGF